MMWVHHDSMQGRQSDMTSWHPRMNSKAKLSTLCHSFISFQSSICSSHCTRMLCKSTWKALPQLTNFKPLPTLCCRASWPGGSEYDGRINNVFGPNQYVKNEHLRDPRWIWGLFPLTTAAVRAQAATALRWAAPVNKYNSKVSLLFPAGGKFAALWPKP